MRFPNHLVYNPRLVDMLLKSNKPKKIFCFFFPRVNSAQIVDRLSEDRYILPSYDWICKDWVENCKRIQTTKYLPSFRRQRFNN